MNQNLALVQEGSLHTDFESVLTAVNWCTPSLIGVNMCVSASAAGGIVVLNLVFNTPFGSYAKSFNVNANTCFTWTIPVSISPSAQICVSNLNTSGPNISFTLSVNLCITIPIIGRKCVNFSNNFNIPGFQQPMLRGGNVSSEDLSTLFLLLAHEAGAEGKQCNCH